MDTEGSVPDNVSGWEGTESLLGRGGSGGSSMYPGVGKPGRDWSDGDNIVYDPTNRNYYNTRTGKTISPSEFLDILDQNRDSWAKGYFVRQNAYTRDDIDGEMFYKGTLWNYVAAGPSGQEVDWKGVTNAAIGLAGKGVDMAFGTSVYKVGIGQSIGSWGNDFTSFVATGGTGGALLDLIKTPSLSTGANYFFTVGSYPYSMYYDKHDK